MRNKGVRICPRWDGLDDLHYSSHIVETDWILRLKRGAEEREKEDLDLRLHLDILRPSVQLANATVCIRLEGLQLETHRLRCCSLSFDRIQASRGQNLRLFRLAELMQQKARTRRCAEHYTGTDKELKITHEAWKPEPKLQADQEGKCGLSPDRPIKIGAQA